MSNRPEYRLAVLWTFFALVYGTAWTVQASEANAGQCIWAMASTLGVVFLAGIHWGVLFLEMKP